MTPLEEAINTLENAAGMGFTVTGTRKVSEPGIYLYLKGLKPFIRNKDSVRIDLIIAGTELMGVDGIISRLYALRARLRAAEGHFNGMDIFRKARALKPHNGLFRYAIKLETEIYNELLTGAVYE